MGGQLEDSHSGMRVFLFLGIGMMTDFLKGVGTTEAARDSLKMDVNKPAIWSAQDLRTRPVIPSGPAAFLMFTLISSALTSAEDLFPEEQNRWSSVPATCIKSH